MNSIQNTNVVCEKKVRNSNLELLRIVATFFVIVLHYNNAGSGGGFLYTAELGLHFHILLGFEMMAICAVNIFVMISGYFMCESSKVDISKPLLLFVEVVIFSSLRYALDCATGANILSVSGLVHCLIPLNWYVAVYVALYLISPYLNKIIRGMTDSQFRMMLIVGLLVFSIWPSVLDAVSAVTGTDLNLLSPMGTQGSGYGYTIVNFILMYFLGAYAKKSAGGTKQRPVLVPLTVYVMSIVLLMFYTRISFVGALAYCNPIVIAQAVSLFQVFQSMRINSKLVNTIASCSFGVYLLHTSFFRYVQIERFVTGNIALIPLHLLVSSILIYTICAIIYWGYANTLRRVLRKWLQKLSFITYQID